MGGSGNYSSVRSAYPMYIARMMVVMLVLFVSLSIARSLFNHGFATTVCLRFGQLIAGETLPFTLIVRDPLGNSFVGSSEHENPADDPKITVRAKGGGGGSTSLYFVACVTVLI